ncbi:S8 family serine peptidase [Uliginosibacterium sp. sgz301328]|uniref:S8 family serine peptidase n=1 Tax=Uliginosibacterium sp. sgz301328 TaxID=3243764 RepID=UPI00359ECAE4
MTLTDIARQVALAAVLTGLITPPAYAQQARVIVKYRDGSTLVRQSDPGGRVSALAARTGLQIRTERKLTDRLHLVEAKGIDTQQLANRLAAQADVEYAVPDRRKQVRAIPNDPLFSMEWYLQSTEKSAINATGAWDITTGSGDIAVAVIDTGVRPDHPDLAGKFVTRDDGSVYGYDFVTEPLIANDGDGRDPDPSDPGDFITQADVDGQEIFKGCPVGNSSWHGTMVSGILAAGSNNSIGVTGVGWGVRVLPVRAMGKCGGYDSDIIAAMYWAAGLPVEGVPTNTHPARVISMSLGGSGTCSAAYRDAVAQIVAQGTTIIVAAGNDNGPVEEPGNCAGVLAVAGVRHTGGKVGYSSFGPEAGIAAPAGNCPNGDPCGYPFITTTNDGKQSPGNSIYTDRSAHVALGTSFATPLVSGTAGLMLSVHPGLAPASVMARIKGTAVAFPAEAGLPSCSTGTNADQQCNCTTGTCGAGLLNTRAAVNDALRPEARIAAGEAMAGSAMTLDGSSSTAATGRRIASYLWLLANGNGVVTALSGTDQAQASALPSVNGTFVVSLTVTDDQGATDTSTATIAVGLATSSSSSAASSVSSVPANSGGSGGGGGGGGGAADPLMLAGLAALAAISYGLRRTIKPAATDQARPPR